MIYKTTTLHSRPSKILEKITKLLNIKTLDLTEIELFWLQEDEVIDTVLYKKLFNICNRNKLNINTIFFTKRMLFADVPMLR